MESRRSPNWLVLTRMALAIEPLLSEVVFVGGQVTELLITAPGAVRPRPTDDVDVVVGATTKAAYHAIEQRLYALGFQPDPEEDTPICRWVTRDGDKLDIMPLDEEVLGFGSRWYSMVVAQSVLHHLTDELMIRIPTAPLFLATKWEAFTGRGQDDLWASHDLEDIISLVAGRPELLQELRSAEHVIKEWVGTKTKEFLGHADADYAIMGAVPDATVTPSILEDVRTRLELIAGLV